MISRIVCPVLLTLAFLAAASQATAASRVAPDTLADSTVVESWTLDNGLAVSTRHVPDAQAVAITLGFAIGTDDDPGDREGLALVLDELVFMSAAGNVPARTR